MTNCITVTDQSGNQIDYESAVLLMDDAIREQLHDALAPCSPQEFYNAYVLQHRAKFHDDFVVS